MKKVSKMFGESILPEWGEEVKCPECGFECTHIESIKQHTTHKHWDGGGYSVTITMFCESGHRWTTRFGFHKGNVFVKNYKEKRVKLDYTNEIDYCVTHRQKLEQQLDKFKQDCLAKFDKGRKEHNEDISKIDYEKEIYDEMLDLVNYSIMKKLL